MSSALFENFSNLAWPPRVSIVQGGRGARAPRNAEVSFLGPCRRRESLPKPRHDSFCEQDVELLSLDNISRAVFAEFKPKSFVIAERAPPPPRFQCWVWRRARSLPARQKSCELGPRSRLAFNIEIGGPGGGAEATHLHNGGSPSKSLAQFFSRNIVPLPTEQLRLPRQPRPLVVPAVKARRGGVTQQRGKAILCQSIQGPSGGRRPHSLCIEQHSRPRHPQGASVALARACHPREQSLPSLMQSMAAGASEAGLAQTSTDGARLSGHQ